MSDDASGRYDSVTVRVEKYVDDLRHNSERRSAASFDTDTADQIADELESLLEEKDADRRRLGR